MRFIFFILNGSKRAREAILFRVGIGHFFLLLRVGTHEPGVPTRAHRSSTAKSRNTRFLILLHQVINGSRGQKVFYVVGVPGSNGITDVEPEADLILGEGVRFLPGQPEALENAFYLQLKLKLERFRVIVEPHLGHLDNGKTAINGRSTILGGLGGIDALAWALAWHLFGGKELGESSRFYRGDLFSEGEIPYSIQTEKLF